MTTEEVPPTVAENTAAPQVPTVTVVEEQEDMVELVDGSPVLTASDSHDSTTAITTITTTTTTTTTRHTSDAAQSPPAVSVVVTTTEEEEEEELMDGDPVDEQAIVDSRGLALPWPAPNNLSRFTLDTRASEESSEEESHIDAVFEEGDDDDDDDDDEEDDLVVHGEETEQSGDEAHPLLLRDMSSSADKEETEEKASDAAAAATDGRPLLAAAVDEETASVRQPPYMSESPSRPSLSTKRRLSEQRMRAASQLRRLSKSGIANDSASFADAASTKSRTGSPGGPANRALSSRFSFSRQSTFYSAGRSSTEVRGSEDLYEVEFNRTADNSMLQRPVRAYPTNYIRTTKYTVWTFIPVNLFFQFRRFYNIYFLLAAIFVLLEPSLDPTSNILPLCIVLVITAIKDGLEDYKRYKQDKQANTQVFTVVREGKIEEVLSMNVVPGDIVYLTKDEHVPADLVLLSSSIEDGTCYIDTVELDGETSLKTRAAVSLTQGFTTPVDIMRVSGHVECELPNERLNLFEGLITLEIDDRRTDVLPLSMEQLLLRGSSLRNTEYVYGVVIYAGEDTKVFKNLKQTGLKFSTLERRLNKLIVWIFGFNAVLIIVSMCMAMVETQRLEAPDYTNAWYLPNLGSSRSHSRDVFGVFMVFFVIYTFVVPVSVFVSVELVRLAQISFMMWDKGMRSASGRAMKAHNSNLNEDLGAVEYIFSDKTGTLTQNMMRLSKWYVGSRLHDETASPGALLHCYEDPDTPSEVKEQIANFARCVAICHAAIPVASKDGSDTLYESPSPDESALLYGLREDETHLLNRSKDSITVSIFGKVETYEVLRVLDFTSDRKRMSVIVRNDQGTYIYCKGADNIIESRLHDGTDKDELSSTNKALIDFSVNGLRTLVMAWKSFKKGEYEAFSRRYDKAECALRNRDRKVARACELVEVKLRLLGCSAIEDKLQDQVPETIDYLLQADIRIWLLTGDKQETAIKVGKSSRLISAAMNIMILNAGSGPDCDTELDKYIKEVEVHNQDERNALVVDGESLVYILLLPELSKKFLQIGVRCRSVICCRVTPLQKALVVRLVKKQLRKVTLSIGDGANDVSMIQATHVGVGIEGMEGAQAVRASDYSFVEFKALRRLISVHGRYSYMRIANIVLYSLYKSVALITVQFWFGFFNAWCGRAVYQDHFLTLWNVAYTSLPPIAMAIFDKDVDEEKIAKYPQLYKAVKDGQFWNVKLELGWAMAALWHSLVVFGAFILILKDQILLPNGQAIGYTTESFLVGNFILMVVTLRICLLVRHWVWVFVGTVVLSLLANFVFLYGLELFNFLDEKAFVELYSLAANYFGIAIVVVICCLPDFMLHYYLRTYRPSDAEIIQEETLKPNARPPLRNPGRWVLALRRFFGRFSSSPPSPQQHPSAMTPAAINTSTTAAATAGTVETKQLLSPMASDSNTTMLSA